MTHTFEADAERCSNCRQTRRSAAIFEDCFIRPAAGTVVNLPCGSNFQDCIVLDETEDGYGMVAAKTTKRYTTRDQWGFRVYHKAGQKTFFRPGRTSW